MKSHDSSLHVQTGLAYGLLVKPGRQLRNGATIIACRRDATDTYIVLAMWLRGRNDCEYVTWSVDEDGEACWADLPQRRATPDRDEEEQAPAHDVEVVHQLEDRREVGERLVGDECGHYFNEDIESAVADYASRGRETA